jgi:hypothetical protein
MFVCVLAAGLASAQNPSIIQNTRDQMNTVRDNATAASNAALGIQQKAPSRSSAVPAASAGNAVAVPTRHNSKIASQPMAPKTAGTVLVHKNRVPKPPVMGPKSTVPVPGVSSESETAEAEDPASSEQKYNPKGKRDPFLSPVVNKAGGSGCSAGKKCLEIGTISLRGVVRSDNGFIAVVSNGMNKAYFLRENDPVFNGYVIKINADSIVFQETLQDHLGKTFTREIVKKITTPAV